MLHEDIVGYYKINFALMQHHKYSLSDIENMILYLPAYRSFSLLVFVNRRRLISKDPLNHPVIATVAKPDSGHIGPVS